MIPVAILCGGAGTRIAAIAGDLPKALIPVAGAPFISHQLRWLRRAGATSVVLLTGYRGDQIAQYVGSGERYGLAVTYSDDGPLRLGTAGAVGRALPHLGPVFLTVYGDSLLPTNPFAVSEALGALDEGVMSVFYNRDAGLPSNVTLDGDRVATYEKQAPLGTMTHLDYGINAFRASVFSAVPDDGPVDLSDVHAAMIARRSLRAVVVTERWYEIGSPEGLAETERYLRTQPAIGDPV
jgi:MurNAc alpha-1-phosphate uridylyltransferase